ncbi:pLS20_p028 family conjugation system transmembrane protein, partial [Listeria monocytogenes]
AGNLAGYFSNKGKESGGDKTDKKSSPYNSTVTAGKEKPGETSGDGTGGSVPSKDSKEANPLTKHANANTIKAQSPETGSLGTNDSMNTPDFKEDNPLQQNGNIGADQTASENQKEQPNQADEKDKGNTDANKLQTNPKTTTASLSADKSKAAESISPSKASNGSKVASPDQTQGKTTSTSPGNIASPVSSSDTSMMTPSASSGDAISGGGVTGNEPPAGYQDSQNDTSSPEPTTQQVENVSQAVDQAVADQVTPARPTENRTVGEFAKDVVKDKIVRPIANTRTVRASKKSFEISRNSAIKRASKKNTIPPRGGK